MLSKLEIEKLLHNLKRMAKALKILEKESDHENRQTLISLLIDEADRMAGDIEEMRESGQL
jgi:hypothetical protein